MAVLTIFTAALASAQEAGDYPNRVVKFISPFPPGGLTDLLARVLAEKLQADFRQPVIVENRPGLGTLIGAEAIAKAPPDGYTLGIASSSTYGISPLLYPRFSTNPVRDLTPIARVGATNFFLISSPSLGAKNLAELIELVRRNPGKFNYASSGTGTPHHLYMEALKTQLGLDIQHVPYKGSAQAIIDFYSGKIQLMFVDGLLAIPNIKAGKAIGMGTAMARQSSLAASVPPIGATVPGYDWDSWQGIAGPAGLPWPIVQKVAEVMRRFQATQEYRDLMLKTGMEPLAPIPPEKMADFVKGDLGRWARAVKISGAKVD
jgi:tripartite-type tricarboxylate transporter receptor subunit TctC